MYKKIVMGVAGIAAVIIILPQKAYERTQISPITAGAATETITAPPVASPEYISSTLPKLEARSVLALDMATGTNLYAQNFDEKLPIASLTKLMTAMVVLDHTNKEEIVTVEKSDIEVVGSNMGLVAGEQISVENLLKGMLIPSSNDAAQTLARFVGGDQENFVRMMNAKAHSLKLSDTEFSNPVGLDSVDNYSTALDLSIIAGEFLKYAVLSDIVDTKSTDVSSVDGGIIHHLHTSNKLLLENPEVVGVKTGFTTEAQGSLVVKINHDGAEVLTIVLNTPNREDDSRKLIDWIFKAYRW